MLFREQQRDAIVEGDVTVSFRRWSRPRVRAGGRYRLDGGGVIEVQRVLPTNAASVNVADARRAGFASPRALLAELARSSRRPLDAQTVLFRVEFTYVQEADPRRALAADDRLSRDDLAALGERLARMDARAIRPWTREVLRLIEEQPRVPASRLAAGLGRETAPFKADVRKLKQLGLTISLERGYELSPRGHAYLAAHAAANADR